MLVQDEGLDIVIENVDFAGVTTDVILPNLLQHHLIRHNQLQELCCITDSAIQQIILIVLE